MRWLEVRGRCLSFSNMSVAWEKHRSRGWPSVPSPPCDRPRAWWSLLGRTYSSVCQMQILQFLYNMERTIFGADWMVSLCLLWNYQENSHQIPLTEDARYCWKFPHRGENHKKGHFFIKCFHFLWLFRDNLNDWYWRKPVTNNKKRNRQEQDPIVLVAVQIQRRHRHSAKTGDYKILMEIWIIYQWPFGPWWPLNHH